MAEGVGDRGLSVGVGVALPTAVGVGVSVRVGVGVRVRVDAGVADAPRVEAGVPDAPRVKVGVPLAVWTSVGVAIGLGAYVGVMVAVGAGPWLLQRTLATYVATRITAMRTISSSAIVPMIFSLGLVNRILGLPMYFGHVQAAYA